MQQYDGTEMALDLMEIWFVIVSFINGESLAAIFHHFSAAEASVNV